VLDTDPLADVCNVSHVSYVLKDGHVFTPKELMSTVHCP
jgi:hypothetical protein